MSTEETTTADVENSASAPVAAPAKEETDPTTATSEQDASAEGKEADGKTTPEDDAAKASEAAKTLNERKRSAQERINEAVGKQRQAERERDAARREAEDLRKKLTPPDPTKYDDVSKLTADQVAHTIDSREAERLDRRATEAEQIAERAVAEAWLERVSDFKADNPDFEEVAYKAPITDATAKLVAEMEDGPAIAYWLGKNPSEARRIDRLSERAKMVEMGRISARISMPPPRRTTEAPKPVSAVGGKNAGRSDFDPENASMAEYVAKRNGGWGE
jgi:hypothetical protein